MAALSQKLAAAGTTGNNTHTAVPVDPDVETVAFQFNVSAIGATPTVTFKYQGTVDGTNWFDVFYVTDSSDTASVATRVVTAPGSSIQWLSNVSVRKYTQYRCVTTANTNITYNADVVTFDTSQ